MSKVRSRPHNLDRVSEYITLSSSGFPDPIILRMGLRCILSMLRLTLIIFNIKICGCLIWTIPVDMSIGYNGA